MKKLIIPLIALTMCGCYSSKRPVAEARPPAYQPTPEAKVPLNVPVAAPKPAEVQEAVKRVFKDAAVIDTSYNPSFLTGDFNGDGSQDLAVIVKPVKVEEMNEEMSPWLVRQPRANKVSPTRLHIDKDEPLLAVIHGYGANHWRDPDATQTFVLKDVVGNGLTVQSPKDFVTAHSGRKIPRPQGDLIGETVAGTPGYLYFTQATYAWYDPKTFDDSQSAPGAFHKSRAMR